MKHSSIIIFLLFLFCSSSIKAEDLCPDQTNRNTSEGQVLSILVHTGDAVMFSAGERKNNNKMACSKVENDWAFSLKTPTGKAMYALILSAQAQGRKISVVGTCDCSAWVDRETAYYIYTK